jgi:hypothetical protein
MGSSLLEGCAGHNLAEAAVAGCAVLVGEHAGHFGTMADELNQAAVRWTDGRHAAGFRLTGSAVGSALVSGRRRCGATAGPRLLCVPHATDAALCVCPCFCVCVGGCLCV